MQLCDFPLLSSELAQFTCDDLAADWQIGEAVSVQGVASPSGWWV